MQNAVIIRRFSMLTVLWLVAAVFSAVLSTAAAAAEAPPKPSSAGTAVYIVPVKQTVESGLQSFLERALGEAEEANAERIILVINTLGGRVDSADEIGKLIRESPIPTTAFIEGKAVSAGTFIALNADMIVMQPSSTIGAAAIVDAQGTLIEDAKVRSYWVSRMVGAAELNGRDPNIAVAMTDPRQRVELPKLDKVKGEGEVLSISAAEAVKVGYADHIANSVDETLAWLELEDRPAVEVNPTFVERMARWLVQPWVQNLLLIAGIAGIAIELLVPGFGVPGIIGLLGFGLFFFGHYVAGFAGMESVVLFVIGVALLIIEIFVPSFGILGTLGIAALVGGVTTAAYDSEQAVMSLLLAFLCASVIVAVVVYIFRRRGVWNRFILRDRLTTEEGYVSTASRPMLLGQEGVTLTPLRPSGTIQIGEERIDAVTEGGFIASGAKVRVSQVEGTRVVVREI
ncbi:nodulation protein NfeD [Paenibacillus sambharensis]|uniref:Nodulation protein NfeD n=1 Tax=Paenibacillus sambharensis TaxID=1803190 RepID=A0A2W1L4W4_9BACL|nr:nodulation protein NfeD [Paenibacillus sambharensis]PZD93939.1 nodulation protein NfeD [Paenibacillus sambharensis]